MRSFRKPEWRPVPPRKELTKEHVRALPPARIENAQQADERVSTLLATIGLTGSQLKPTSRPWAFAIPGLARWRCQRQRWWFVINIGSRGRPHHDDWRLLAILDALTGELRWWGFSHIDEREHQRVSRARAAPKEETAN